MIVFSNTTPLLALSCVDKLSLLPALFQKVWVAEAVVRECAAGGAVKVPELDSLPWIEIVPDKAELRPDLWQLDAGERQTLELALENRAGLVLIDEKIGRNVAEYLGLRITGTLGVLLKARQQKLLSTSFKAIAESMRAQGFYYSRTLIDRLAASIGE